MEIPADAAPALGPTDDFTPAQRRRAVAAATIGNGLEFYDFITFAFFAIQIGNTFFPSESKFLSLMGALATFGAGFVTRPLGAFFLGGFADRRGRKPAMLISMSMMGIGIILLCVTPGYSQIGYAAPVVAVLARMIQGFALGGEVGAASVYMMESAQPHRRGWSMSWQGASQNIAATLGSLNGLLLTYWLTADELSSFGWRIALGIGATIVPFALWIRNSLPETIDKPEAVPAAASEGLQSYVRPVVCGFFIIASGTIATYIFQYMATFGQNTLHLSQRISFAGEVANNGIAVIAIMIGGAWSDRIGRRPVQLSGQLLFAIAIVPGFLWLTTQRDAVSFIGANLILSLLASYYSGATYAAISESVPRHVRARAFALVYSLSVAIFGGTTQLVVTWILHVTGNPMALAWYLTVVTLIGAVAMWAMRESAPVKLRAVAATA
jgi:MHS family citrate/tricarballylate:H+ symporter-like MFS transporter